MIADAPPVKDCFYSSGLQVRSADFVFRETSKGVVYYLQSLGPTQLLVDDTLLTGHDIDCHPEGFGSPVGLLRGCDTCLADFSTAELEQLGVSIDSEVQLEFESGVRVCGRVQNITRHTGKNVLISFSQCRVEDARGKLLFDPAWGLYDMAVGRNVIQG